MNVTDMMDQLVCALNHEKPHHDELSLWYSWNDGCWKWAYVTKSHTPSAI